MLAFLEKEVYTSEDINSLLLNEAEESIHLEFKAAGALDRTDIKKNDISKDVSSFANSDGGIIIYGVEEVDHKASRLSFVDGDRVTKEWLEQVINSSIQKRIPDITIFPLRFDGQLSKTVYVIKIPKSNDAPHISRDKRFYKRFNFESVPMEEYEVRDLYGRRKRSLLTIDGWSIRRINEDPSEKIEFVFEVQILNDGDVSESDYKVNLYLNIPDDPEFKAYWEGIKQNVNYTRMEDDRVKLSEVSNATIFPSERMNALRVNIDIPKKGAKRILESLKPEIVLFYSAGQDRKDIDLTELIAKVDQAIEAKNDGIPLL